MIRDFLIASIKGFWNVNGFSVIRTSISGEMDLF